MRKVDRTYWLVSRRLPVRLRSGKPNWVVLRKWPVPNPFGYMYIFYLYKSILSKFQIALPQSAI